MCSADLLATHVAGTDTSKKDSAGDQNRPVAKARAGVTQAVIARMMGPGKPKAPAPAAADMDGAASVKDDGAEPVTVAEAGAAPSLVESAAAVAASPGKPALAAAASASPGKPSEPDSEASPERVRAGSGEKA